MLEIQGHCHKCQAPLFLNRTMDCFGNSVLSLHCWNGHYKWIDIEDIEKDFKVDSEKKVVTFIGFFDVS